MRCVLCGRYLRKNIFYIPLLPVTKNYYSNGIPIAKRIVCSTPLYLTFQYQNFIFLLDLSLKWVEKKNERELNVKTFLPIILFDVLMQNSKKPFMVLMYERTKGRELLSFLLKERARHSIPHVFCLQSILISK